MPFLHLLFISSGFSSRLSLCQCSIFLGGGRGAPFSVFQNWRSSEERESPVRRDRSQEGCACLSAPSPSRFPCAWLLYTQDFPAHPACSPLSSKPENPAAHLTSRPTCQKMIILLLLWWVNDISTRRSLLLPGSSPGWSRVFEGEMAYSNVN